VAITNVITFVLITSEATYVHVTKAINWQLIIGNVRISTNAKLVHIDVNHLPDVLIQMDHTNVNVTLATEKLVVVVTISMSVVTATSPFVYKMLPALIPSGILLVTVWIQGLQDTLVMLTWMNVDAWTHKTSHTGNEGLAQALTGSN